MSETYASKNYMTPGGAEWHIGSGGKLVVDSGGIVNFASGAVSQVGGSASPASITFSAAASTSNVSLVTVTVVDGSGATLAGVWNFDLWLSDASTGAGLTATTASGAVAASSGTDIGVLTSKKALRVQTATTGIYVLSITDTAKTLFYVAATIPGSGRPVVSSRLATGSYG